MTGRTARALQQSAARTLVFRPRGLQYPRHPSATMKTLFTSLIVVAALMLGLSSCNTTRGVGQDVQTLGRKIERTAERRF